jgi:hypothetical protein
VLIRIKWKWWCRSSYLANLFQGGDEAAGPSDSMRVVTIVDRGVQQAKLLTTEPKIQAELYANLGPDIDHPNLPDVYIFVDAGKGKDGHHEFWAPNTEAALHGALKARTALLQFAQGGT